MSKEVENECQKAASGDKEWTESERLELAAKLDAELDEFINGLEKKRYTEGWPENRWQEEMEKHPFFMKESPNPGETLSPLMEGLQQLKYDEAENTSEELANNYKEDGNYNYKYKNYRLAIVAYTEGIKTKCKDDDLMAQLYNNRAASNYMLQNYRTSLNDCNKALELKPKYSKALGRAANCCFKLKRYEQCMQYCDEFLEQFPTDEAISNLRVQATKGMNELERDARRQQRQGKRVEREDEKVLQAIQSRNIRVELKGGNEKLNLAILEPQIPQIACNRVHLDSEDKLVWPVIILYPETQQTDFIQCFHEDSTLIDQLDAVFEEPPEWDLERRYEVQRLNVYFEEKEKSRIHKVDKSKTLREILADPRFVVRGGAPAFLALVASSEAEKRFLANY